MLELTLQGLCDIGGDVAPAGSFADLGRKLPKPGAGGTRGAQLPVMDAGYPANAGWMAVQVAGMSRISSAQSRVALPGGNRLTSPK
jgi:hypothetical protein